MGKRTHFQKISQRRNRNSRFPSIFHRNLPISLKFPPKNYGEILTFFVVIPPYHPASNGSAERAVQTVKQALNKMWLDHKRNDTSITWSRRLADFLLTYRSTPHSVTKQAPSDLFMKRILRTRLSLVKPNLASAVEEKQHQRVKYHDKKGVKSRELRVNQSVLVRNHRDSKERWIPDRVTDRNRSPGVS